LNVYRESNRQEGAMITVRPASERGHFNHGWLDTYHTFSFADYQDPRHMRFRALRVINEDRVAPGHGFPMHFHRDMEIITYVLDGELEHKDSLGNGSIIRPGDGQRMSAGSGIMHSEFNPSRTDPVHLLQIWIMPERRGIEPGYEQKTFASEEKLGHLRLIASPEARDGSVRIHQDAHLYVSLLPAGEKVEHELAPGRHAWLQVGRGAVSLDGKSLSQGDGAAVSDEKNLVIKADKDSEILLFDLA
jgi:redox-sensitive bicupin YhaK (pirin superfamily)